MASSYAASMVGAGPMRAAPTGRQQRPKAGLLLAAAAMVVALLAGCTSVVTGVAVRAPGPESPGVDVALLDPGNYPRRPGKPLGKVADENAGRLVEAYRMANNVVGPWEVDSSLVVPVMRNTRVLTSVDSLTNLMGPDLKAVAASHTFVVGFTTMRESPPPPGQPPGSGENAKTICNAVLRFASPEDAAATATEMAAKDASMPHPDTMSSPLPIPNHPDALANKLNNPGVFEADLFTARGPYVLFQDLGTKESADALIAMITRLLDLQVPLIDRFQATPSDQFANLPADPTGLLARTVSTNVHEGTVLEPHAALHFRPNPVASQQMFTSSGVQRVAVYRTSVYEAIDPTGADRAVESLVRMDVPGFGYKPVAGIRGLPGARCFDRGQKQDQDASLRYLCVAAAERYAIRATAAQERDVHQVVASQYLMLTAK